MKTSEHLDQIVMALLKAQSAIGGVVKDKTGKVQTKTGRDYEYKYSDLAAVIEAVKGPLNSNGIVFLQTVGGDSTGIMVTTRLLHESAQWIEETMYIPITGTPQALGSAITYAKRYSLQSMVGVPSEDDDAKKASENDGNKASEKNNGTIDTSKHTARQVAVDAFDGMPGDEQTFLRDEAIKIIAAHEAGQDVNGYISAANYDTEEKLALWSLLPSNVRTAIKKARAPLASQP